MKRGSHFAVFAESWICSALSPIACMSRTLRNWLEIERRLVEGIVGAQQAVVEQQVTAPNPSPMQTPITRAEAPSQVWNFAVSGPPATSSSSHQQTVGPADANEHDLANAHFTVYHSSRWDFSHNSVAQQPTSSTTPAPRRSCQSPGPEKSSKKQRVEDKQHKGSVGERSTSQGS